MGPRLTSVLRVPLVLSDGWGISMSTSLSFGLKNLGQRHLSF